MEWTHEGKVSTLCVFFGENRGRGRETSGGKKDKRKTKQTDEKVKLKVEKIAVEFNSLINLWTEELNINVRTELGFLTRVNESAIFLFFRHNVKAIFFMITKHIEFYPRPVREAVLKVLIPFSSIQKSIECEPKKDVEHS